MSLAMWLGVVRKCSAAVVGLDLVLGLSMVQRCSLKRSLKGRLGPVYMVSGTRDNPPPRDNFTERLYEVVSFNSCPL